MAVDGQVILQAKQGHIGSAGAVDDRIAALAPLLQVLEIQYIAYNCLQLRFSTARDCFAPDGTALPYHRPHLASTLEQGSEHIVAQQTARAREQHPRAVWILFLHPAKINYFPLLRPGLEGNHPFFTRFSCSKSSRIDQKQENAVTPERLDKITFPARSEPRAKSTPPIANAHQHCLPK